MKRHCKRWIECTFRVKMQHFAFDIQLLSAVCSCVKSNLHYRFELSEIISAILCSLSLWNLNSWQAPRSDQPTQSFPLGVGLNTDLISTWEDIDNFFIFWQIVLCIDRRQFCQKALLSTLAATIKVPCYDQVHVRSTTQLACRTWICKALDTCSVTFEGWMWK